MHRDHVGRGRDVHDRREVVDRVVRDLGVDRRVGRRGGDRGHADVVAIGRGAREFLRAHHATAAGAVEHDHVLAQGLAQGFGHDAADDVGGAAGREGHLQRDGFAREALRQRGSGGEDQARGQTGQVEVATLGHAMHSIGEGEKTA